MLPSTWMWALLQDPLEGVAAGEGQAPAALIAVAKLPFRNVLLSSHPPHPPKASHWDISNLSSVCQVDE